MSRRCPVCLRKVEPTLRYRLVRHHRDSIGRDVCPMSGEPYALADPCDQFRMPA